MKKWISLLTPLAIFLALVSFDRGASHSSALKARIKGKVAARYLAHHPQIANDSEPAVRPPFLGSSLTGFKEAIAFSESSGNYFTTNSYGYLGKYQFGINTLELLGISNAVRFLNTPELQEQAFLTNLARNKWILRKDIARYCGTQVGGVEVTESGILAAAHLAGAGNVKRFLRSGGSMETSDAFGTSISYYMRKFQGFDTSRILPAKNPRIL